MVQELGLCALTVRVWSLVWKLRSHQLQGVVSWPWEGHFLTERSLLPHKCHIYSNFLFWPVPFSFPDTQLFTYFAFPCAKPPSLKAFFLWLEFLSTDLFMSLTYYSLLHLLRRARMQKNIQEKSHAAPPSHRAKINVAVRNAHTTTALLYKCFCAKLAVSRVEATCASC